METEMKPKSQPMTPAAANLARAMQRDRQWHDTWTSWIQTVCVVVIAIVLCAALIWAAVSASKPPEPTENEGEWPMSRRNQAPAPATTGVFERTVPEGMFMEDTTRDVVLTPTPTPAPDRRKPRSLDPPERIEK